VNPLNYIHGRWQTFARNVIALNLFLFYSSLMFCARDTNMNKSLRSHTVHIGQTHIWLYIHCSSTKLLSVSMSTMSGLKWDGRECIHVSVSSFLWKVNAYKSLLCQLVLHTADVEINISWNTGEVSFNICGIICNIFNIFATQAVFQLDINFLAHTPVYFCHIWIISRYWNV
jgi:hypothetical protein